MAATEHDGVAWEQNFLRRCSAYEASHEGAAPYHKDAVQRALHPGATHLEAKIALVRRATEATLFFIASELADENALKRIRDKALGDRIAFVGRLEPVQSASSGWWELKKAHLGHLQRVCNVATHDNPDLPEEVYPALIAHLGAVVAWGFDAVGVEEPPAPIQEAPPRQWRRLVLVGAVLAALGLLILGGGLVAMQSGGMKKLTPTVHQLDAPEAPRRKSPSKKGPARR